MAGLEGAGIWSLPPELHIHIFSFLSYRELLVCETISPLWYNLFRSPVTHLRRYTQDQIPFTETLHDKDYYFHRLLRDYYILVHSRNETNISAAKQITVTLVPVIAITPAEADQFPRRLNALNINWLQSRELSSIPGVLTLTNAPFLNDPVWVRAGRQRNSNSNRDIWLESTRCSHISTKLSVSTPRDFTIKDMLKKTISCTQPIPSLVLAEHMSRGMREMHNQRCSKCSRSTFSFQYPMRTSNSSPEYLRKDRIARWTYRDNIDPWKGLYSRERYFVNLQNYTDEDAGISGKLVKMWHWGLFREDIMSQNEGFSTIEDGHELLFLGIDTIEREGLRTDEEREGATIDLTNHPVVDEPLLHLQGWRYRHAIRDMDWNMGLYLMWNQRGYRFGGLNDREILRQDWFSFTTGGSSGGQAATNDIALGDVDLDVTVREFIDILGQHILKFDALRIPGQQNMRLRMGMYGRLGVVVIRNVDEVPRIFDLNLYPAEEEENKLSEI
ncbi:hypothetical protein H072_1822 [Dactylellina haptotyla CBS 200.50]|uniref:F-box domain-containing protein n=1 Tax=Dactylellina haptotyla (strain CBS 200.50) TaxID=1284197 RepID=S8BXD2_DACHA|nr:hypothetical protein H072_1822 [Dactylellina haptotyla CBS 200.50]